jgi:hypothetical protein
MKIRAPHPVVLTLTAIIAASFGGYYLWRADTPASASPRSSASASEAANTTPQRTLEELRAAAAALKTKIDNAWSARLAAQGETPAGSAAQQTADSFSAEYAADIAELDRLTGEADSAPWVRYSKAVSRRTAARVAEYDAVRARLSSGELKELPPDLAPPLLPEPSSTEVPNPRESR